MKIHRIATTGHAPKRNGHGQCPIKLLVGKILGRILNNMIKSAENMQSLAMYSVATSVSNDVKSWLTKVQNKDKCQQNL